MDIEILRPFGPSIVKVQLPLEIINQMNDYTDTIVKDKNKLTELDHGKKLVGNVQQEIVLEVEFMKKIKWAEFLASNNLHPHNFLFFHSQFFLLNHIFYSSHTHSFDSRMF